MKQLNVRIDDVTRSQLDYIKTVRRVGEQVLIKMLFDEEFKRVKIAERDQTRLFEKETQNIMSHA